MYRTRLLCGIETLVLTFVARFVAAMESWLSRAADAPQGVARGGAPLLFGLALLLAAFAPAGTAWAGVDAATGVVITGEVLSVQESPDRLVIREATGVTMSLALEETVSVTLNGRSVRPLALRPVLPDALVDVEMRIGARGEVQAIEAYYDVREAVVVEASTTQIVARLIDEWGQEETREFPLAKTVMVKVGGKEVGLKAIRPGSPILVLLDRAGQAKKIELPS